MAGFPAYGATILLLLTFATFVIVAVFSFSFGLFSFALLIILPLAIFSFPLSFAITDKADVHGIWISCACGGSRIRG